MGVLEGLRESQVGDLGYFGGCQVGTLGYFHEPQVCDL